MDRRKKLQRSTHWTNFTFNVSGSMIGAKMVPKWENCAIFNKVNTIRCDPNLKGTKTHGKDV